MSEDAGAAPTWIPLAKPEHRRWKQLAQALSLLDGEVKWEKSPHGGSTPLLGGGKRWCAKGIQDRLDQAEAAKLRSALTGIDGFLETLLAREEAPGSGIGLPEQGDLQGWLTSAVQEAIKAAVDASETSDTKAKGEQSSGAGAIYLYDWRHDELVMAASAGFPFQKGCLPLLESLEAWANAQPEKHEESRKKELERVLHNLGRLAYLKNALQARVVTAGMPRHEWVRHALRSTRDEAKVGDICELDCNTQLVGVAYYILGSDGITGQLFHKEEGPLLERIYFSEQTDGYSPLQGPRPFREHVEACLRALFNEVDGDPPIEPAVGPPSGRSVELKHPLLSHLSRELLPNRTVVFDHRADMAAGRQVKAGRYEGLQFPDSEFIGPFLGTVLRFNGEHLGILKVERHRLQTKERKLEDAEKLLSPGRQFFAKWRDKEYPQHFFKPGPTADFLVFAYVVAGLLYVSKHHFGIDIREAWEQSSSDRRQKESGR